MRSAQTHVEALEHKGYIRKLPGKSRGIELVREKIQKYRWQGIPLVGRIAAGHPIPAAEEVQELVDLDVLFPKDESPFALRVQGDSMIEAGIFDGDLVIVQPRTHAQIGEIVVALLDDEATVKFLGGERDRLLLVPANSHYQPIPAELATIVGRVIGVIRQVRTQRKIRSF